MLKKPKRSSNQNLFSNSSHSLASCNLQTPPTSTTHCSTQSKKYDSVSERIPSENYCISTSSGMNSRLMLKSPLAKNFIWIVLLKYHLPIIKLDFLMFNIHRGLLIIGWVVNPLGWGQPTPHNYWKYMNHILLFCLLESIIQLKR